MSFEAFPLRDDSDRAAVQQLWRDNFGDRRIKDAIAPRWRWLTEANPAGPVKICVVTQRETGAVIGSAGALPRVLRIGGTRVPAAVLCDFVVDKRHRVAGAAVSLQRKLAETCFADGIKILYGFPNRSAFPVFARVGFKTVGSATMMVRPLRSGRHLRDYVPVVLADTAGFLVDRLLHAYDFQFLLRQTRALADTQRSSADGSFQALWDEVQGTQAIVGERTPDHLNWRYARHPIEACSFFCLTERFSGRLRGYVAYCVTSGKVNVLDAFWASADALQPLFVRFVWRMRTLGHESITVCHAGDAAVARTLRQLAFIQSKEKRNLICKVAVNGSSGVGATAYDLGQWSLFDGELDI
jgi:hypothetical protein